MFECLFRCDVLYVCNKHVKVGMVRGSVELSLFCGCIVTLYRSVM